MLHISIIAVAASAPAAVSQADLVVLADVFLPARLVRDIVLGGCSTAMETKWAGSASDRALEAALPGVHAEMGKAALATCERELDPVLDAERARVMRDWQGMATPGEIAKLASALRPAAEKTGALRVPYRQGDMARSAVRRVDDAEAAAAQRRALTVLAAAPGGGMLVMRVAIYQQQLAARTQDPNGPIIGIVRSGLRAAHARANVYAGEKGQSAPYPND